MRILNLIMRAAGWYILFVVAGLLLGVALYFFTMFSCGINYWIAITTPTLGGYFGGYAAAKLAHEYEKKISQKGN